jgi:hypothetical protein
MLQIKGTDKFLYRSPFIWISTTVWVVECYLGKHLTIRGSPQVREVFTKLVETRADANHWLLKRDIVQHLP